MVTVDDLMNFAANWLASGSIAGDLDGTGQVDSLDYSILESYWLDLCPDNWQLK